jgi:hypothetical protein
MKPDRGSPHGSGLRENYSHTNLPLDPEPSTTTLRQYNFGTEVNDHSLLHFGSQYLVRCALWLAVKTNVDGIHRTTRVSDEHQNCPLKNPR